MKLLISRRFSFEMAHALPNYEGKCANIHGHSYHMEVTVRRTEIADTTATDSGMVMDFHCLKELVEKVVIEALDHKILLPAGTDILFNSHTPQNLVVVPFQPTTENLLLHCYHLLQPSLPEGIEMHSIRLSETDNSTAELLF